jgi:hypothetical protein
MSSPTKLRKALQQAQGGELLENTEEQAGGWGGRESPLDSTVQLDMSQKDHSGTQSLPAFLSEERIKSIMLGIVPCSNHDMGVSYKLTMRKLGIQQDGVALHDFEPKELCAMLRSSHRGMRSISCNILKDMCEKLRGGSASAKAGIQEAVTNGLLLLLFTCAAQACKAVDSKMEVGDDGMTEPASQITDAQSICDAIGALSSFEIFDEHTTCPLPDATKLCRLASAVCSLWRNCHYTGSAENKKPVFVNAIMNMALTITQAMIFFESHPMNTLAMAWEHRGEIYQIELSDKQFLRSLLMVVTAKPRTPWAAIASRIIRSGTNVAEFCHR